MKSLSDAKLIFSIAITICTLLATFTSFASTPAPLGNSYAKDASEKGTKLYFLYGDAKAGTKFRKSIAAHRYRMINATRTYHRSFKHELKQVMAA